MNNKRKTNESFLNFMLLVLFFWVIGFIGYLSIILYAAKSNNLNANKEKTTTTRDFDFDKPIKLEDVINSRK